MGEKNVERSVSCCRTWAELALLPERRFVVIQPIGRRAKGVRLWLVSGGSQVKCVAKSVWKRGVGRRDL